MLVREGLQVTRAATGIEGLEKLAAGSWDAVFLDVRLPDVSGPEIYHRLEASQPELAQRVIFVTGGVWRSESRLRPGAAAPARARQAVHPRPGAQRPEAAAGASA
jgi:CheY-like chemotaxis protein